MQTSPPTESACNVFRRREEKRMGRRGQVDACKVQRARKQTACSKERLVSGHSGIVGVESTITGLTGAHSPRGYA
eukprot:2297892-Pleurochrysis_carterae.AAC.1